MGGHLPPCTPPSYTYAPGRSEGTYRLHLQGYESVNSPTTLKTKAGRCFETAGTH